MERQRYGFQYHQVALQKHPQTMEVWHLSQWLQIRAVEQNQVQGLVLGQKWGQEQGWTKTY